MATTFKTDGGGGLWTEQRAGSALDYTLDWSDALDEGDSIAQATWTADAGLVADRTSFDATTTTGWLSGGIGGTWYRVSCRVATAAGRIHVRGFRLLVAAEDAGASGFPSVFADLGAEVAALRRDRLAALAAFHAPGVAFSDEYALGKLVAAEREVERALRVFLTPREVVPEGTPQAEIDALEAAGNRVHVEPGYDYEPRLFSGSAWGAIDTRHRPVSAVRRVWFHYPIGGSLFEINPEWIRLDKKYGRLQFVPLGAFVAGQLGGLVTQAVSFGTGMPLTVRVAYRAGLEDARRDWPDILQLIRRKAVVGILDELYLPSAGSVSGDGLSQSFTIKLGEHRDALAKDMERTRQALHGVQFSVL